MLTDFLGIRKHTFAYPGRKDTIKACVYVKELVRFMLWNAEERKTSFDLYNCTYEPAYTIEQIVKAMKRVTGLNRIVPYIPNAVIMPLAVRRWWRKWMRYIKSWREYDYYKGLNLII